MIKNLTINSLSKNLGFFYWTKNKISGKESWSKDMFKIIGASSHNLFSFHQFISEYVHENDQYVLIENLENYIENKTAFKTDIRVRKKNKDYYWLTCKSLIEINDTITPKEHLIVFVDINKEKKYKIRYEENKFFYQESAEMTRTGGWFIDFEHKKTYWDRGTRNILGISKSIKPSIKIGLSFFSKEYKYNTLKHLLDCSRNGFPFHMETKLNTKRGHSIWAIIIGKPIYNEAKVIIGMRGVLQDIYELKMKELSIKKSMDIISSQNTRLYNFAHIVSHNLRSHSSNLDLIIELIKDTGNEDEKEELFGTLIKVSESLNKTIEHLNEVAAIHTFINRKVESIRFNDTLQLVTSSINQIINQENALIESDFSEVEDLEYVPAYLESIFLNLITNAIKYKHPKRSPHIYIKTYKQQDKKYMIVKDNGSGIDLESFGSKVFSMYGTFHQQEEAVGIGLFMTKNQIESLNGTIDIESEVGVGTVFTINF